MRMSDRFPLPLHADIPAGETLAFDTTGAAAEAAVHAVNHHDALVEALSAILSENAIIHSQRRTASALLEQIKNDK